MNSLKSASFFLFVLLLIFGMALLGRYSRTNLTGSETKISESKASSDPLPENTSASKNPFLKSDVLLESKSLTQQTSTEDLIQVLQGNKTLLKMKAQRLLADKKENILPILLESLENGNNDLKVWILRVISARKEEKALPYILPLLTQNGGAITLIQEALKAIVQLQGKNYSSEVISLLSHSHLKVRVSALETLTYLEDRNAIPFILELLKNTSPEEDPQEHIRGAALVALSQLGNATLIPDVKPYLISKKPDTINGAFSIFRHWDDPLVYEFILEYYHETRIQKSLEFLAEKKNVAHYFVSLLQTDTPSDAFLLALGVIQRDKYKEAIDVLKSMSVSRPELKTPINATLLALDVEFPEMQNEFGALKGFVSLFELYPDAEGKIIWRRLSPGRELSIKLTAKQETEKRDPVFSDKRGRFLINQLKVGSYRVEVTKDGFLPYQQEIIITPQMNRVQIPLLKKSAETQVHFIVLDTEQKPISEAKLFFIFGDKYHLEQTSNQEGKASFNHLIPGKYRIEIQHPQYKTYTQSYQFFPHEQTETVTLTPIQ